MPSATRLLEPSPASASGAVPTLRFGLALVARGYAALHTQFAAGLASGAWHLSGSEYDGEAGLGFALHGLLACAGVYARRFRDTMIGSAGGSPTTARSRDRYSSSASQRRGLQAGSSGAAQRPSEACAVCGCNELAGGVVGAADWKKRLHVFICGSSAPAASCRSTLAGGCTGAVVDGVGLGTAAFSGNRGKTKEDCSAA